MRTSLAFLVITQGLLPQITGRARVAILQSSRLLYRFKVTRTFCLRVRRPMRKAALSLLDIAADLYVSERYLAATDLNVFSRRIC